MADVSRHELVLNFPVLVDYTAELLADIVVEHLVLNCLDMVLETGNDAIVGVDAVDVVLGL